MGFMDYLRPTTTTTTTTTTTSRKEEDTTSPSEITPLDDGVSSSTPPPDIVRAGGNNSISFRNIFSYRVLAFVGGIAMTFTALIDPLLHFSLSGLIVSIYTFGLGVLLVVLEWSSHEHTTTTTTTTNTTTTHTGTFIPIKRWQKQLKFYVRLLDFTWGRGYLSCCAGGLMISNQHPYSRINIVVGTFMVLVGLLTLWSSNYDATTKLVELQAHIDSKRDLKRLFAEYDVNKDGALNEQEFAALLCHKLDVDSRVLTYHEIAACFHTIDENEDGTITYEEFKHWWNHWGRKRLRRRVPPTSTATTSDDSRFTSMV